LGAMAAFEHSVIHLLRLQLSANVLSADRVRIAIFCGLCLKPAKGRRPPFQP